MKKIRVEWLAAALVVIVAVVLTILLVSTLNPNAHEADITLPDRTEVDDAGQAQGRPREPGDDARTIAVTPDNVQNVIATLQRPEEYYIQTEHVVSYDDESRVTTAEEWVTAERCAVRTVDSLTERVQCTVTEGERIFVWYEGEDQVLELGVSAFAQPDLLAGLTSWEDILSLDPAAITLADHRSWEETPCIFVESYDGTLGYSNRWYVSLATGLLIHAETYAGGELVYSMNLLAYAEDASGGARIVPPTH